jgi:hypothetical protein
VPLFHLGRLSSFVSKIERTQFSFDFVLFSIFYGDHSDLKIPSKTIESSAKTPSFVKLCANFSRLPDAIINHRPQESVILQISFRPKQVHLISMNPSLTQWP